jgi:hypothetical protein
MSQSVVLADNGKFRLEMEQSGSKIIFRPIGVIDEDVNFSILLSTIADFKDPSIEVAFDVSQVNRMNSCGVREWILLVEKLSQSKLLQYVKVGSVFLEQANMIPNLFGKKGTPVKSFEAPYHCPHCDQTSQHWIETTQVKMQNGRPVPPSYSCATCRKPLVFDWDEDEYFSFMKRI